MNDNRDELAEFGREVQAGRTPEIEPGGTLAPRGRDGGHGRPEDPGEQSRRRRPPQGRSHGCL
jgi:hypothetical protein